jgi:hypothetical protein
VTPLIAFSGKIWSPIDHFLPKKGERVGFGSFLGKIWLPIDHFLPENRREADHPVAAWREATR